MARAIDGTKATKEVMEYSRKLREAGNVDAAGYVMWAALIVDKQPTIDPVKQEWISVKDDMPKEHDSIFARFYGTDKWRTGMFRTASDDVNACVEYEDGSRLVKALHTIFGEWHMSGIPGGGVVTHWMPLPEPPKEGE